MILRKRNFERALCGLLLAVASTSFAFAQQGGAVDEAAQRQAAQLRRLQQQLQNQQQELTAAMNALQAQLAAVKQQTAQAAAQPGEKEPLGEVRVFRLRRALAESVRDVLAGILGDKLRRMAIDPSTNSLVILARDEDFAPIIELIQQLDVPTDPVRDQNFAETLQLRFAWVAGGLPDSELAPASSILDPQVVQAVESLGIPEPRVIGQHVTSVAKRLNENVSFGFMSPAVVGTNRLRFEGSGELAQNNPDQFQIQMTTELKFGEGDGRTGWEMTGSVAMPPRHYVVMGTTNLILGSGDGKLTSHPAAFVLYVDRANTFTEEPPAEFRGQPRGRGGRSQRPPSAEANPFGMPPSGQAGRRGSERPAAQKNTADEPFKE
jgi:hypothetical protein